MKPSMTLPERLGLRLLNAQGLRSRWLKTSVGKMHAIDGVGRGDLPSIVLMHGLSANAASYGSYLRRLLPLAQRVIAPDLPGHGLSDIPKEGLCSESMLTGGLEVLDQLIDRPAILVGNSMGGLGAIRYALARPEKVRGLLLVSPGGAPMESQAFQRFLDNFRVESHAQALEFVDRMFAKSTPVIRHAFALGIRDRFRHPELRRLIDGLKIEDMLRAQELAQLRVPTLLIWGREERILPRCQLAFFADNLPPAAEIEEWPDFGHCGFLEQPEGLARRTIAFARGISHKECSVSRSTLTGERDNLRISA